jgi:hypothetical protein
VPVENAAPLELFNGNGLDAAYRTTETLERALYKGEVPMAGNDAVQQALEEIAAGLKLQLTVAQRIPARTSVDPTVGEARAGRALRIATTVGEPGKRALFTIMPTQQAGSASLTDRPAPPGSLRGEARGRLPDPRTAVVRLRISGGSSMIARFGTCCR